MEEDKTKFKNQPSMVEIMGHKRIYGRVTEEEHAGTMLLRVDTEKFTQFFTAQAIFSITPIAPEDYEIVKGESHPPITLYEIEGYGELEMKYRGLQRLHHAIREDHPGWEPPEHLDTEIPF